MGNVSLIEHGLQDARRLLEEFMADRKQLESIAAAGDLLAEALRQGGKVLSCGNGGSLCDAMHFAEELTGRFRNNRSALPAIAIADPAHITCTANDFGFEYIFSRYVEALGKEGDVLLAISTSGNSENIIRAIDAARAKGMKVVGLTGKTGGRMKELCDVAIVVPWNHYSDRIQEIHIKIIHILIEYIEQVLYA